MIIYKNEKYAKSIKEFTESLFVGYATCVGFYRENKHSYTLYDHKKIYQKNVKKSEINT